MIWHGDNDINSLIDEEYEIFGQLLDQSGGEIGINDFRISDMGDTGDNTFNALSPDVTYNSVVNEYLVAWEGDDNVGKLTDNEFRIFGQLLGYDSEVPIFKNGFE
ncbi:MAG: hypothetical protein L3J52_02345 [Proteobacteria bacterium]|nr:hypothetical protein [Pseudomonadota bacterium]